MLQSNNFLLFLARIQISTVELRLLHTPQILHLNYNSTTAKICILGFGTFIAQWLLYESNVKEIGNFQFWFLRILIAIISSDLRILFVTSSSTNFEKVSN